MRFSSLDQLIACPGYVSFDRRPDLEDEEFPNAKKSREWGTMVHGWKETGNIVHEDPREARLFGNRIWKSEKNGRSEKLDRFKYWPAKGIHELHVGYHWPTGHGIVDYSKPSNWYTRFDDEWIVGVTDFYYQGRVSDLKTGKIWEKESEDSMQVTGYGAAISGFGLKVDTLEVIHWPKYPAKEPPRVIQSSVKDDTFPIFKDKVTHAMNNRGKEFNPSVDNCRFCPARFTCPFAEKEEKQIWQL